MTGEARAAFAALDDECAMSGEIGNARAVICLADGDPDGTLAALWECWSAQPNSHLREPR